MADRRVDPSDGHAYTHEEIQAFYKGKYNGNEINEYWGKMKPSKGRGRGQRGSAPGYAANTSSEVPQISPDELPEHVEFLAIDGSFGEGGGQVLRNTFAYAAVLGKAIHINKIRAGRPKPGLANQHLTGITAVSQLAQGKLLGAEARSCEVYFIPGAETGEELTSLVADCGTAGALTLVIQSILPVLVFGGCSAKAASSSAMVTCRGGTDVPFSPAMDYLRDVTLPNLSRFGINAVLNIDARGIMPAGGGVVNISCPRLEQLTPLQLVSFGQLESVRISTLYCGSGITEKMAQEVSSASAECMRASCSAAIDEVVSVLEPLGSKPANFLNVSVTATTSTGVIINGNALHQAKQVKPEALAMEACSSVLADIERQSCLDGHCADQVIIFMALAAGRSSFRTGPLSEHTRTAVHFAQVCTGCTFQVEPVKDASSELVEVSCDGIGLRGRV